MAAEKKLSEPKTVDVVEAQPNKGALGKAFKKDAKSITDALATLDLKDVEELNKQLESKGWVLLAI